ncbi:MAG TPA: peptidylprolyl isomerase [Mycobacterium sp.]|nr:peptidylprolyl isomerase [Mycobacterium sp.]
MTGWPPWTRSPAAAFPAAATTGPRPPTSPSSHCCSTKPRRRATPARLSRESATVIYPRGTVAMATNGPNTNGSQFFVVFRDAEIEPTSTVFGSVDEAALATLDKIAKVGVAGNRTRGMPASTVTINSVRLG